MIRPIFLYAKRAEADIEGTAWRKLSHSDWEFRIIFLFKEKRQRREKTAK